MTSTSQLVVGLKGKKDDIHGMWLSYNNSIRRGFRVGGGGTANKPRCLIICGSEKRTGWKSRTIGCRAHIDMKPAPDDPEGDWVVTSVNLNHTCTAEQSQRMRQVPTKHLAKMSEAVSGYAATATRKGNTKQFIKMVQNTAGVTIKKGQSLNHIHSLSHDELHQQIAQYYWLPGIFESILTEDDPDGSYILQHQQCRWSNRKKQFKRCHIAPSFTEHFWKHGVIRMMVGDGTFTRGNDFKHVVLLAVTFDAENKIVVLAAAIVPVENADHWTWFHGNLRVDFPGVTVFMADADEGIRSDDFVASQGQGTDITSRCCVHLSKNCKENCGGMMNNDHKKMILRLAASRTMVVYRKRLQELKKVHKRWPDWLDARKSQFVAYTFLIRGRQRWGKVTSNGVENINSAILPIRCQPIAHLILEPITYMQDKYTKGKERANQLNNDNKLITDHCRCHVLKFGEDGSKLPMRPVESNHPIYIAQVGIYPDSTAIQMLEVKVNVENYTSECACLLYNELGMQCAHVCKLLMHLNQDATSPDWNHPRYHTTNHTAAYSLPVPVITTAGRLTIDTDFIPPEHKRLPGGPKGRQDKMATYVHKTDQRRKCKACGKRGHMSVRCDEPSTQYRCATLEKQAVKWARKQIDIQAELLPNHDMLGAYEKKDLEKVE